ncbi:MAG: hypothetical protein HFG74_08805 [Hungatella sp.]|nr:hypothetical protein [Hungatella sp.]
MEKEKRIKREENRLKKIFREVEENRKRTVEGLIKRAAFMRVSLEEFEQDLNENGFTEQFQQGEKQDPYDRKRPVADLYNTMNTSYQKIIKQLTDLLPEGKGEEDELLEFLSGKRQGGDSG